MDPESGAAEAHVQANHLKNVPCPGSRAQSSVLVSGPFNFPLAN